MLNSAMPWNHIFTHIMNNEWQSLIYQNRYFKKGLRVSPYRILTQYLFVLCKALMGVCVCFVIATHWHEKVTKDDWMPFSTLYTPAWVFGCFSNLYIYFKVTYTFLDGPKVALRFANWKLSVGNMPCLIIVRTTFSIFVAIFTWHVHR